MFAFARNPARRPGAKLALAVALVCGTALGAGAVASPAHAQKKKEEAPKANYSKKFIAAYKPVDDMVKAGNAEQAKPQIAAVVAAVETADDRNAAGGLVFNVGTQTDDPAMQRQGLDMMIASGRSDATKVGQFNFTGYQLASQADDYEAARKYLEAAIAADYSFEGKLADGTTKRFVADDMRAMMAESYFDQNNHAAGLTYLQSMIEQRVASGQTVPDTWIRRGLSVAYQNELAPQALDFARMYVQYSPSETSWSDAIAIQRNMVEYDSHATLDLLRLAARTKSLRDNRAYIDYIDAADARRLPAEVKRMVDEGVASGKLKANDPFVIEATQISSGRIAADKADLPALERDAKAANATAVVATAAGDAFLGHGEAAKAEAMYRIALGKPGADMARVQTRLGIALADQGKTAEAVEAFGQVQGDRAAIAKLWTLYLQQNTAPTTVATTN
jgi:tetratricopeptide (TPR) repeat protein